MSKISNVARWTLTAALACLTWACSAPGAQSTQSLSSPTPDISLTVPPAASQNPEDKMPRLDAPEAKKLVDAGQAIVIDVRGPDAYKAAHIKGSLDFPLTRLEAKDFKGLPKDKRIIAYCT